MMQATSVSGPGDALNSGEPGLASAPLKRKRSSASDVHQPRYLGSRVRTGCIACKRMKKKCRQGQTDTITGHKAPCAYCARTNTPCQYPKQVFEPAVHPHGQHPGSQPDHQVEGPSVPLSPTTFFFAPPASTNEHFLAHLDRSNLSTSEVIGGPTTSHWEYSEETADRHSLADEDSATILETSPAAGGSLNVLDSTNATTLMELFPHLATRQLELPDVSRNTQNPVTIYEAPLDLCDLSPSYGPVQLPLVSHSAQNKSSLESVASAWQTFQSSVPLEQPIGPPILISGYKPTNTEASLLAYFAGAAYMDMASSPGSTRANHFATQLVPKVLSMLLRSDSADQPSCPVMFLFNNLLRFIALHCSYNDDSDAMRLQFMARKYLQRSTQMVRQSFAQVLSSEDAEYYALGHSFGHLGDILARQPLGGTELVSKIPRSGSASKVTQESGQIISVYKIMLDIARRPGMDDFSSYCSSKDCSPTEIQQTLGEPVERTFGVAISSIMAAHRSARLTRALLSLRETHSRHSQSSQPGNPGGRESSLGELPSNFSTLTLLLECECANLLKDLEFRWSYDEDLFPYGRPLRIQQGSFFFRQACRILLYCDARRCNLQHPLVIEARSAILEAAWDMPLTGLAVGLSWPLMIAACYAWLPEDRHAFKTLMGNLLLLRKTSLLSLALEVAEACWEQLAYDPEAAIPSIAPWRELLSSLPPYFVI